MRKLSFIAFHSVAKTLFEEFKNLSKTKEFKNLSNAGVLSQIGYILNPPCFLSFGAFCLY